MDINVDKIFFSQKIESLNISDKTKALLISGGIESLKDLVAAITRKLVHNSDMSIKDATIECLLDIRRFDRDNALDLMEELRRIDFFEEIDWELELSERLKEQEEERKQEEARTAENRVAKEKRRLAKEI